MDDSTITDVLDLGRRWAEAEQRADVEALDALAVADFALVGPLGFVLDKQQWLDRYRIGNLVTTSLTWGESDFDAILDRIRERGLPYWADPFHRQAGQINTNDGGRGVYWEDPNGHNLEIITRPYGSGG